MKQTLNQLLIIAIVIITSLTLTGCKKEGCTDKNAINYSSKAKKDNGSCKYPTPTGSLIVYVKNYIGNSVSGREVWLYTSETNFNNADYTKIITTDNNGRVEFKGLASSVYWVDCQFNDAFGNPILVEGNASVTNGYSTTITIKP